MDLHFLSEYFVPVIVGICLCVGYILKKWIKDIDNKWIPTINGFLGVALAIVMHWGNLNSVVLLSGFVSGLAATGLHQAFRQLIESGESHE